MSQNEHNGTDIVGIILAIKKITLVKSVKWEPCKHYVSSKLKLIFFTLDRKDVYRLKILVYSIGSSHLRLQEDKTVPENNIIVNEISLKQRQVGLYYPEELNTKVAAYILVMNSTIDLFIFHFKFCSF